MLESVLVVLCNVFEVKRKLHIFWVNFIIAKVKKLCIVIVLILRFYIWVIIINIEIGQHNFDSKLSLANSVPSI